MPARFVLGLVLCCGGPGTGVAAPPSAEQRATAFLAREVPRWAADNKCYSCHNNGDAVRALIRAGQRSQPVPATALAETLDWLSQPDRWDKNGGNEAASDKGLARIQFAAALADAVEAGLLKERQTLTRAAELVAEYQRPDGAWKLEGADVIGSPATYGTALATHMARRTLQRADPRRYRDALAQADRWFLKARVITVLDAAAVLLGLEGRDDPDTHAQRRHCMDLIRRGRTRDGGWGPYVASPAEPFDTAVVILALRQFQDQAEVKEWLRRGRAFLLSMQREDGSWPETTRPAGDSTYAQRMSTTSWATLALLDDE